MVRRRLLIATLILVTVFVLSCHKTPVAPVPQAPPAPSLIGTEWRLEDLSGTGVLDRVQASLVFPGAGKVAGKGSCNSFFGSVAINGNTIKFTGIGSTMMACAEPIGDQERRYLKHLETAERFAVDGTNLSIYSTGVDKPLRFTRTKPN